jgi:hypothetical protein
VVASRRADSWRRLRACPPPPSGRAPRHPTPKSTAGRYGLQHRVSSDMFVARGTRFSGDLLHLPAMRRVPSRSIRGRGTVAPKPSSSTRAGAGRGGDHLDGPGRVNGVPATTGRSPDGRSAGPPRILQGRGRSGRTAASDGATPQRRERSDRPLPAVADHFAEHTPPEHGRGRRAPLEPSARVRMRCSIRRLTDPRITTSDTTWYSNADAAGFRCRGRRPGWPAR